LQKHKTIVPVELFVQAKAKDPPNDALPRFLQAFTSAERVGTLTKEPCTGKLIDEWNKALSGSNKKPEIVDIAPSVSSFMAVKDEEELVSRSFCTHPPYAQLRDRKQLAQQLVSHPRFSHTM